MRDFTHFDRPDTASFNGWRGYTHGTREQTGMEAFRLQIEQKIEAVRAEIEERIGELKRNQHENELTDQIGALEGQLSFLDAQMMSANTATLASLISIQTALPRTISATALNTSQTMAHASFEGSHHIMEMTTDKIAAMDRYYATESAEFRAYEQRSFSRVEQLASANGVDIAAYRETRARHQADYEEAKQRGDTYAMAGAEAGTAYNNVFALKSVGANDAELDEALDEAAKARTRLSYEAQKAALVAGRAAELEGDDLRAYVDQQTNTRLSDFDSEQIDTAVANGTPREEAVRVVGELANRSAKAVESETARTRIGSDSAQSVQIDLGEDALEAADKAMKSGPSDPAPSPFGAVAVSPFGAAAFEVAEADPAEEKTPNPSPALTAEQQKLGV